MSENTQIEAAKALETTVATFKIGNGELKVKASDFLTDIKSGRTFIQKKKFRELYGLTSGQCNRFYKECREKFSKAWTVAQKAQMELEGWNIIKRGNEKELANGDHRVTITLEKPAEVEKEESLTSDQMIEKLNLPSAVQDIVRAALAKKEEVTDVVAVEV